ncbi:hypothetical protein ACFO26_01730 [Lactococcus nasutitermitis]|uniref:Phage protein n=1 Tax=Lactococcus nasutitermitis TaxID=1652957 RepID=A0ABV9JAC5_9LACT|nr:hypothetical protein [Lactococcus nasutitermitis]
MQEDQRFLDDLTEFEQVIKEQMYLEYKKFFFKMRAIIKWGNPNNPESLREMRQAMIERLNDAGGNLKFFAEEVKSFKTEVEESQVNEKK